MAEYLENGDYLIDVTLEGGSGKATIASPAELHVNSEGMTAEIEWSSPNYDYMKIGDKEYYPVNDSGNSLFIIDLDTLDAEIPITAETTAMSRPHMIDYTLHFNTESVQKQGMFNYTALGICVAAAIIAVAVGYRYAKK